MPSIPFIDVRAGGLGQLVRAYPERAKILVKASRRIFGMWSDLVCHVVVGPTDRLSRGWMAQNGNPYLAEIDDYAAQLQIAGIHALNICFEWGCTSAVYGKEGGPVLSRVLDWAFPKLGENAVVALQTGSAGDFYNVTWPGVSGMFHGMAPGRFAASLNQAPMRRHRLTYIGDWVANRRLVFQSHALPPAHLLRQVFEKATSYAEAKKLLCETSVALPVIYILGGAQAGEGCVIERTEDDYALRAFDEGRVCAANHFETPLNQTGCGWRPRHIDSAGRARQAQLLPLAAIDEQFGWFQPPIANGHSRLVIMASAAAGRLDVFGTDGVGRITEVCRIKPDC